MTLWVEALVVTLQFAKFNDQRFCGSRVLMYLFCPVTLQDHMLFTVWNYPGKFCSHSHCGKGKITYLTCQVTFQNHVIKRSSDFMEENSSFYGTRHCGSRDIVFSIYHVASRDHLFKGLCNFANRSTHSKSPSCQIWWLEALL